jgi:CspA family cold shock protein
MAETSAEVKRLVSEKGFGFVLDARGVERFFHRSACKGVRFEELKVGDRVWVVPSEDSTKGPRCTQVTRA